MKKHIFTICLILIFIPNISPAKTKTIFADHKYVMGDNDSRNDARRMCFLEAKRKVLEKAGTYIESHTEVKNYQLAKDEISAYSAALLKIDTVKEEWKYVGDNLAVLMTVKAKVDTSLIEKRLLEIKQDSSLRDKLQNQQRQLKKMEQKIDALQKQIVSTDQSQALPLIKERITTFAEIDKIEARYKYALNVLNDRKAASVKLARKILKYIEMDMTPEEVEYILGKPDRRNVINREQLTIEGEEYDIIPVHPITPEDKIAKDEGTDYPTLLFIYGKFTIMFTGKPGLVEVIYYTHRRSYTRTTLKSKNINILKQKPESLSWEVREYVVGR